MGASKCEAEFVLQALRKENVRIDGRALAAYRKMGIRFGDTAGEVEVNFGPTRVLAVCTGEIVVPEASRPNEGRIIFSIDYGPMASPAFDVGRPTPQAQTAGNLLERLLKGSRAIDAEALCIIGGQKVWSIRVDVRALDDDGNLSDACAVAALAALLHFRKVDVEVQGDRAQVFTSRERVPVPLSIHHLPVPVSFALFSPATPAAAPTWVLDPNRLEEAAMSGVLCIAVNQFGELCGLHKPGGCPLDYSIVEHCIGLAVERAKELTERLTEALEADKKKREQAARNVHKRYADGELLSVDWTKEVMEAAADWVPAPERASLVPSAEAVGVGAAKDDDGIIALDAEEMAELDGVAEKECVDLADDTEDEAKDEKDDMKIEDQFAMPPVVQKKTRKVKRKAPAPGEAGADATGEKRVLKKRKIKKKVPAVAPPT
eukprot:gnl/MRDRNA2_/MRDRNA2_94407_c0_seq1.p1 gnl/MRDRNA2_/MRDRNA2_94407_c0~~gnl/MRDRNA2_/MRDRNA2_94407_c0_seq1.p1  ORF type:complete len:443 (+),score=110.66 gnl/MRDRNA2_/MRDRNA2_94407_c0_seq1:35-1330(+)